MKNDINCEYNLESLDKHAAYVVELLTSKGYTVASAESCTGGLLSALITSVSGASSVFELGLCVYADKMKSKFLGVSESDLEKFGAVSSQVALAMAKGLSQCSGADICVSVTGIAGPCGGTKEKPVGTVWLGFCYCGKAFAKLLPVHGITCRSRDNIRKASVEFALNIITEILMEEV